MKNNIYRVLKKVYDLSAKYDDGFVPKRRLIEKGCPEDLITHLEFQNYLNYLRKDKEDFYCLTLPGIAYLQKCKQDYLNIILSFIAAIASIVSVVISVIKK